MVGTPGFALSFLDLDYVVEQARHLSTPAARGAVCPRDAICGPQKRIRVAADVVVLQRRSRVTEDFGDELTVVPSSGEVVYNESVCPCGDHVENTLAQARRTGLCLLSLGDLHPRLNFEIDKGGENLVAKRVTLLDHVQPAHAGHSNSRRHRRVVTSLAGSTITAHK